MQTDQDDFDYNLKNSVFLLCPFCKSSIPEIQINPLINNEFVNIVINCSCLTEYKQMPLNTFINQIKSLSYTKKPCINHNKEKTDSNDSNTQYCPQCNEWLCSSCIANHSISFKHHSLLPIELHLQCKDHHLNLTHYCCQCQIDICSQCLLLHKDHCLLLPNSQLDINCITALDQSYSSNVILIKQKNNELKHQFDSLINTHLLNADKAKENNDTRAITEYKNSIDLLYKMNAFNNQSLIDLLKSLFHTLKLFGNYYNHHLEKLSKSIRLDDIYIQFNPQNSIRDNYFQCKHYYSNYLIIKQNNTLNFPLNYLSPIIRKLNVLEKHTITTLTKLSETTIALTSNENHISIMDNYEITNTLRGHTDLISCLIHFIDNLIITSSWDQTIRVWDINSSDTTTACIATHKGTQYFESVLKISNDLFISVAWNNLEVWRISPFQLITSFQGHSNLVKSLIRLNDHLFASASWDKTVKIWNLRTLKCVMTLIGHTDLVYCLVKVNNDIIASGSRDKTIRLWHMKTGECIGILKGNNSAIISLALLKKNIIASGSYDGSVIVWDCIAMKAILTNVISIGYSSSIRCLLYLGNNQLICGSNGMTLMNFGSSI